MEKNVVALLRAESKPSKYVPYGESIGSLLYSTTCTRPDISYSVGTLAQFFEAHRMTHWAKVKPVFRYIKGTEDTSLVYERQDAQSERSDFVEYSDSDWAVLPCRKSTSGSTLFYDSCLVMWKSRKQALVEISTTEAEMIAGFEAYKEQKSVHKLFQETGHSNGSRLLYRDIQACITILHDTGHTGRANHNIGMRFLAIRDVVKRREIALQFLCNIARQRTIVRT